MKVTATGNIVANAIVRQTNNGKQVMNFTIAVTETYRKKGDAKATRKTTFVQCAYWGSTAIAPLLEKGVVVEVTGNIGTRVYLDRVREPKTELTLTAINIKLHGKPSKTGNTPAK